MTMRRTAWMFLIATAVGTPLWADPCGLVPPIVTRQNPERFLMRKGDQITFVFFKNGIQDVVLRPAFEGKVDEFGMLIPFASVPAIRKVADDVFAQIADAVQPPTVTIDLSPPKPRAAAFGVRGGAVPKRKGGKLEYKEVRVLKKEAVGMYQVVVLEAGSAAALKRWMTTHGYVYPDGMDKPVNEYVEKRWCFVAVKARVGKKKGVEPRPGLKKTDPKLPDGATFTGAVQAMGFRFRVKEPVVPMRLSAYNPGKLHNIVYALTDKAVRFKELPGTFVKEQVSGKELLANLTEPLPATFTFWGKGKRETMSVKRGEKSGKLPEQPRRMLRLNEQGWDSRRDPAPHNGKAKELFASNLLAAKLGRLSHEYEEKQKDLLNVGEEYRLRGPEVDALIHAEMAKWKKEELGDVIEGLKEMTLTVIEGDFPREVLRGNDLTFLAYALPKK